MILLYFWKIVLLIKHDSYLARSSWSRAEKPVIEIGDLSEEESKAYLIKKCTIEKKENGNIIKECKIKDEQVNELYKLVGGRIVDLKVSVKKFLKGNSLEGKFGFIIFASNEFIQFCLMLNFISLQSLNNKS